MTDTPDKQDLVGTPERAAELRESLVSTHADTPKIEPCPMPGCGSECHVTFDAFYANVHCPKCGYHGKQQRIGDMSTPELRSNVISAHNTVAGKVRVFGDLVDALDELDRKFYIAVSRDEHGYYAKTTDAVKDALAAAKELEK